MILGIIAAGTDLGITDIILRGGLIPGILRGIGAGEVFMPASIPRGTILGSMVPAGAGLIAGTAAGTADITDRIMVITIMDLYTNIIRQPDVLRQVGQAGQMAVAVRLHRWRDEAAEEAVQLL